MHSCIECQLLDDKFNKDTIYIRKYWVTGYCCFWSKNREYGSKICKHFVLSKTVIDADNWYEKRMKEDKRYLLANKENLTVWYYQPLLDSIECTEEEIAEGG